MMDAAFVSRHPRAVFLLYSEVCQDFCIAQHPALRSMHTGICSRLRLLHMLSSGMIPWFDVLLPGKMVDVAF